MSINAGTREAIDAEELGAGAGGVERPFWCQLTAAVAQLPMASLSQLPLLSRVFDSHAAFYCLPDLTTLGRIFLFNLSSSILQICNQAVCLKLVGRFI